ncbi:MAG: hypothetical protein EOO38_00270 [Cytophagaceae bacterium]|nr:MAG: hypothetical protein EOO38_00270 [Cytophagaceae bacterium]
MAALPCLFASFAKSVMSRLLPLTQAQRAELQVLINQGIDPVEARALVQSYVQKDAGFDESKHPRDHGKFSEGAGSSGDAKPAGAGSGSAAKPKAVASSEDRFTRAERHFSQADHHSERAKELKEQGNARQAYAHTELARQANASAKRELTLERDDHARLNAARAERGEKATAHDDARHAALSTQHADNRAKLKASDGKNDKASIDAAKQHTQNAEKSLGKANAAEVVGDKKAAQGHKEDAAQQTKQAATALKEPPQPGSEKEHGEAGIRNATVQSRMHPEVDKKSLQAAQKAHTRANAHASASDAHAKAGHVERASHHASEASHAHAEAGHHLAEFGELLEAAADKSLEKSAGPKRKSKSDELTAAYLKAFYVSAQDKLPKWQQGHLKRRAQRAVDASLKKQGVTLSQVHVPAPVTSQAMPKPMPMPKPMAQIYVMKGSATEMAYVNQAINLQDPNWRAVENAEHVPEDGHLALEANRLVQGMDMELASDSLTAEQARAAVSRNLVESPGYYDQVGATDTVLGMTGVMLDLGSGDARAVGHIGIDLAPYDYGTVLWDLDLGIPFADACCRAVRMTHSLHPMLDAYGEMRSPLSILLEVQRVLMLGGELYYEGPEPLFEKGDPWPIPGLAIISNSFDASLAANANAPVVQTFRRVPLAVPAFAGADARFAPAPPMPLDAAMAMLAMNASPAETALANFVGKSADARHVPIVKADSEKQICYGEVLNPLTVDSQNDWLTPADIEKAAHDYMMTSRVIGSEHGEPINASVVESFIAPQDLDFVSPSGPVQVPKGTWLIGVKVSDPKQWALVKSGEYSGFSVGGMGVREFGMPDAEAA